MKSLKTLAFLTAGFAYALIVLGAVVRITQSGLGCGDHWPLCNGQLIPSFDDYHTVIEFAHRVAALGLFALIVTLALTSLAKKSLPGVPGRGGILRPALLALGLYFALAVIGAIVVKVDLHALAVVLHLGTAMSLLATLLITGWRAMAAEPGGLAPTTAAEGAAARRLRRASIAAIVLVITAILLGGLTAMTPGAAAACKGFPLCNGMIWPSSEGGGLTHLHWIHRLVAYAVLGHLFGVAMGARRRGAPGPVRKWTWIAAGCATLQIVVAAVMILNHLPPEWRALHQAVGTAVWAAVVGVAWRVMRMSTGTGASRTT
jgi:heme A synthase